MTINNQFIYSLITAVFIGGAAGYLGSLMVTKRMALVGDALGHVALPGMGLALLLGLDVSLGAFVFLLIGILLIFVLGFKTSLSMEALVGITFVTSLALGFLIVPAPDLLESLFGDITKVNFAVTIVSVILSLTAFLIIKFIYPKLTLSSVSEDLAESEGIRIKKYNFIYLLTIAVIVALGIKVTGTLLVGSLVIVPAAAARNMGNNLRQYAYGSLIIGVLVSAIGIFIFKVFGVLAGPAIILTSAFVFVLSLLKITK